MNDTIFALSTVFGKSGIAVFRISGPEALKCLMTLGVKNTIIPRKAIFSKLFDDCGDIIDEGLIIYFPSPASFTGEDVVELNLHGSIAVINATIKHLMKYCRLAEPGEFTKRAFINNKFDLTAAEGITALINAETAMQRKQALKQISGIAKDLYEYWRKTIIYAMSMVEAFIDFPDEDIAPDLIEEINNQVMQLLSNIKNHLDDCRIGQKIKDGITITIVGPPNSGKSTLFNYLSKKNAAIVSAFPGTTRDIIETTLDFAGFLVTIQDTAGIHDAVDEIEIEGISRANLALLKADLILLMFSYEQLDDQTIQQFESIIPRDTQIIYLISKCDKHNLSSLNLQNRNYLCISVNEKVGLDLLYNKILDFLKKYDVEPDNAVITEERHRIALSNAAKELEMFLHSKQSLEILAENLRSAANYLGSITGIIYSNEILDALFAKLCIGK